MKQKLVKFKYCEKATKSEKIAHLFLKLRSNVKTKGEIFFQILWPSQII